MSQIYHTLIPRKMEPWAPHTKEIWYLFSECDMRISMDGFKGFPCQESFVDTGKLIRYRCSCFCHEKVEDNE